MYRINYGRKDLRFAAVDNMYHRHLRQVM